MDQTSYDNWVKVKDALEQSGNVDNFYYKRAVQIVMGNPDPIDNLTKNSNTSQDD